MIIPDRKKSVSMIVSKLSPDGKMSGDVAVEPEEAIDSRDESLRVIATELLSAMERKSALDVAKALKAFMIEAQEVDQELDER